MSASVFSRNGSIVMRHTSTVYRQRLKKRAHQDLVFLLEWRMTSDGNPSSCLLRLCPLCSSLPSEADG